MMVVILAKAETGLVAAVHCLAIAQTDQSIGTGVGRLIDIYRVLYIVDCTWLCSTYTAFCHSFDVLYDRVSMPKQRP